MFTQMSPGPVAASSGPLAGGPV